jgi:hypothetical protein
MPALHDAPGSNLSMFLITLKDETFYPTAFWPSEGDLHWRRSPVPGFGSGNGVGPTVSDRQCPIINKESTAGYGATYLGHILCSA